jgi:hypothetical protein
VRGVAGLLFWIVHASPSVSAALLADLPMCTHNFEQAALQDCFSGLCLRDDWHDPW